MVRKSKKLEEITNLNELAYTKDGHEASDTTFTIFIAKRFKKHRTNILVLLIVKLNHFIGTLKEIV